MAYPLLSDSERAASPAVFGWMPFEAAPGVAHLAVAGDLCFATASEFETVIAAVRRQAEVIVLDLSAVGFLDSSGVHVIVSAAAELSETGRQLLVLPATEAIRRVFEITGASERVRFLAVDGGLQELLAA